MVEHAHSTNGTDRGEHTSSIEPEDGINERPKDRTNRQREKCRRWNKLEDIPVYGNKIKGKKDNVIRLYFENVDGLGIPCNENSINNNKETEKQQYLSRLFTKLDVDIFGGVEVRQQWDLIGKNKGLSKQMDLREGSRVQTSHNVHERFSKCQQGGTCITVNELIGTFVTTQGSDEEGLGRWSWIKLQGNNISTRIISAYMPCVTRKEAVHATMAQQRRYWRLQGNRECPRKIWRKDLIKALIQWRNEGDKLILLMDSNENMENGPLARLLQQEDLQMKDIIKHKTGIPGPPTFIRGKRQIDGAWMTPDVTIDRACFLPFFFGVGDHRAILIDIPQHSILGGDVHKITRPTARKLVCNKEEVQQKYNNTLETYCIQHRIQEKIYRLFPPTFPITKIKQQTLETLDKVISEGMIHAEKKCRRIRMGEVPFSDTLIKAGMKIRVWNLVIRHKERNTVNTRTIRRLAKKCKLQQVLSESIETARQKLEEAWKQYKKYKKVAHSLRYEFLCEREEMARTKKAKRAIRMIRQHEESRRAWRAIAKNQGKVRNNGISSVQINNNNNWETITKRDEVEAAIMDNNSKRFNLTTSTPLMSEYMSEKLGYLAEKALGKTILKGEYNRDPNLDEYTNEFLEFISKRKQLPKIEEEVKKEDFINYWRKARERTSSSLSGRHFGHYKAAAKSNILSEIHASFLHVAAQSGSCLNRWSKGLTVMLEKIKGNTKVDKLRAILLMEADFNFLNKLFFGNRLIKQCERRDRMPEELYGSRKNLGAIQVAVNRRLVIDNIKLKRRGGAIAGVDAAQCYDRIVHSLAILICQREGSPIAPLMMMFGVIQCMSFYIRTTFGDSEGSYGGIQDIPFQGSCQGNGASPALWLVISMYLVLLMKHKGHTSSITTPITQEVLNMAGFLFVDDTDLVITANKNENDVTVYNKLQQSIDFWNGTLKVSGGALKPEKCYWYFARFKWEDGIWSLTRFNPPPITIIDDTGMRKNIEFKKPDEATKAVGVWQNLDGTSTKQMEEFIEKIRKTHESMRQCPLPRHLIWMSFKQSIWKSIEYTLPATTFTKEESISLCKELYRPLLPKLGCNRNFPLLLRYNPPHLLGLGLKDPYFEQGMAKLLFLIKYGGSNTMEGKLLASSIEHHQLEVGSFTPLFQLDYKRYKPLTTNTWVTSLWEFISEHKINIKNQSYSQPGIIREHDRAIMDCLMQREELKETFLKSVNRVRCYTKLFSLADIVSGDGKKIRKTFMDKEIKPLESIWDWPTEKPSKKDFNNWRRAIIMLNNDVITQQLGKWVAQPHSTWNWFYDKELDEVIQKIENTYIIFEKGRSATRTNPIYIKKMKHTTNALISNIPRYHK